jgi:hypothetical protein
VEITGLPESRRNYPKNVPDTRHLQSSDFHPTFDIDRQFSLAGRCSPDASGKRAVLDTVTDPRAIIEC